MSFHRSLESRLLLTTASTVAEPRRTQELVRLKLGWQAILERAASYGIAPLVYLNLTRLTDKTRIPQEVMDQFKGLYYWHAIQNKELYLALKRILTAFSQEEIPVIALKGAALAALVYENIALRPMGDLDLLVRRQDLDTADRLLHELHYVPMEARGSKEWEWYRDHHHHLAPYVARDHGLVIELHHNIVGPNATVHVRICDLWQRARSAQIASMRTLVFAPEHLLLHVSLHLFEENSVAERGMLKGLVDIAETIRRYKDAIDWAQLLRDARTYETEKHLYYAFWLARFMVEAQIPPEVVSDLEASARTRRFEDLTLKFVIRHAVLRDNQATFVISSWILADTCTQLLGPGKTRDKFRILWKHLWQRFMHSAQRVAPQSGIPAPLYVVFVHPFYLIGRAVGRMRRPRR